MTIKLLISVSKNYEVLKSIMSLCWAGYSLKDNQQGFNAYARFFLGARHNRVFNCAMLRAHIRLADY